MLTGMPGRTQSPAAGTVMLDVENRAELAQCVGRPPPLIEPA